MNELERVNGQQAVINAVLARRAERKEVFVVTGPLGSGTSWTLNRCAQEWHTSGGAALIARGEPLAGDRSLFPWLTLAIPGAKNLARVDLLKASIAQTSRAVPVVGAVASYLVEEALDHRRKRLTREALLLTAQEQELLFIIETTAQHKPLLLALDHLEDWDDASWSLLALILSSKLDNFYPSLANALFLVAAPEHLPSRFREMEQRLEVKEFALRLINRFEMYTALSVFRFPRMPDRDIDSLYAVTNGRLDLLHDVGQHLRDRDLHALTAGWTGWFSQLFERRMKELNTQINNLEEILVAAAVVGQAFNVSDVRCLTGSEIEQVRAAVRLATAEHLITTLGDLSRFESVELHRFFQTIGGDNHEKYHAKFADCLRAMRPGEYMDRLHHLIIAGDVENALICYALAALAAMRENRPSPELGKLRLNSSWDSINTYLSIMRSSYQAFDARRIEDGLALVDGIESFLPDVLVAERDGLEAHLLLLQRSVDSYERARRLLEKWRNLADRESELWGRLGQLLLVAQVMTYKVDEALSLEETLTKMYWERRNVDPSVIYHLNVLRRRAECLHHLPTATRRLETALAFFGSSSTDAIARHPLQYYYTLTNLTANQIASGSFESAHSRAMELEAFIKKHSNVSWPGLEVAANNVILAQFLTNRMGPGEAAGLTHRLTEGLTDSGDRTLLENNYAVFLALADNTTEAESTLNRLLLELSADQEPDEYHQYFVANNLGAILALRGDTAKAENLLQQHAPVLNRFYPAIRATMLKRHQSILSALRYASDLDSKTFDSFILRTEPQQLGPQWSFYGRGFLLSDLQFWSAA